MKTKYTDLDIKFTIDGTAFRTLNVVFERFLRTIPSHSHGRSSYEIHYIPSGYGRAQIDGRFYDIIPNTLYMTGPYVEHTQIPYKDDPMSEYCIYLKIDRRSGKGSKSNTDSLLPLFEETTFWFGQDTQNVDALMQEIFYELETRYTGYMLKIEALLQLLIVAMVRNYENKKRSKNQFSISNISDSKSIIIEEYFLYEYANLRLENLSARLGLGMRQTERLLKEHYGKTFRQKKNEAKMSVAAILLSDPQRSITSISDDLGYSSIEHFSSAFKRYYGASAREYRKNLIS